MRLPTQPPLCDSERRAVRCTHFVDPDDFWLLVRDDGGENLRSLGRRLRQACERGELGPNPGAGVGDLATVQICGQFYRCLVDGCGELVELTLLDTGRPAAAAAESLLALPHEFRQLPAQALRCRLAAVARPDGGWTQAQRQLLQSQIVSSDDQPLQLLADFGDADDDSRTGVHLFDGVTGKSVNLKFGAITKTLLDTRPVSVCSSSIGPSASQSSSLCATPPPSQTGDAIELKVTPKQLKVESAQAMIVHVDNLNSFYIVLNEDVERLRRVTEALQESNKRPVHAPSLRTGQACLALYPEDSQWYRACVLALMYSASHAVVQFVDYGNVTTVPVSVLAEISSELLESEAFACHCSLAGCDLRQYSQAATSSFSKLVYRELSVIVKDAHTQPTPVLLEINGIDVLSRLRRIYPKTASTSSSKLSSVSSSLKQSTLKSDGDSQAASDRLQDGRPDSQVALPRFQNGAGQVERQDLPPARVAAAKFSGTLACNIGCLDFIGESAIRLWLQRRDEANELNELQAIVNSDASKMELLTSPTVGEFCIGVYDGEWYRAKVLEIVGDSIRVSFVDFGNEEVGDLAKLQLRRLSPEPRFCARSFAFECALVCGDGTTFKEDAIDRLLTASENNAKELTFTVTSALSSELPVVTTSAEMLADLCCQVSEYGEIFVQNGDAVSASTERLSQPDQVSPKPVVADSTRALPREFSAVVQFVCETDATLYLLLDRDASELERVSEIVEAAVATSAAPSAFPAAGSACIALYEGAWYRAQVAESSAEGVVVKFVDYGNVETVGSLCELRALPDTLRDVAPLCWHCQLVSADGGCLPDVAEVANSLVELETSSEFVLFDGGCIPALVAVKDEENVTSECANQPTELLTIVSDFDFQSGVGAGSDGVASSATSGVSVASYDSLRSGVSPDIDAAESLAAFAQLGIHECALPREFSAVVQFVCETDATLYLLLDRDASELERVSEIVEAAVATSAAPSAFPAAGSACIALYEGAWYRAQVAESSAEGFVVKFVDYGNVETVGSLCELRALPDTLRDVAPLCWHCQLVSADGGCLPDVAEVANSLVELETSSEFVLIDGACRPSLVALKEAPAFGDSENPSGANDNQRSCDGDGDGDDDDDGDGDGDGRSDNSDEDENGSVTRNGQRLPQRHLSNNLIFRCAVYDASECDARLIVYDPLEQYRELDRLRNEEFVATLQVVKPRHAAVGCCYVCHYMDEWHRAVPITAAAADGSVTVNLVDMAELAHVKDLRQCPQDLLRLPPRLTKCRLQDAFDYSTLRADQECLLRVIDVVDDPDELVEQPATVQVLSCGGRRVQLPTLRYSADELRAIGASMPKDYGVSIQPNSAAVGQHQTSVLATSTTSCLRVHILSEFLQSIYLINQLLAEWYDLHGSIIRPIEVGREGQFAVFRDEAGRLHRCQLLERTGQAGAKEVRVRDVDLDGESQVPLRSLFEIVPDVAQSWPQQVLVCQPDKRVSQQQLDSLLESHQPLLLNVLTRGTQPQCVQLLINAECLSTVDEETASQLLEALETGSSCREQCCHSLSASLVSSISEVY